MKQKQKGIPFTNSRIYRKKLSWQNTSSEESFWKTNGEICEAEAVVRKKCKGTKRTTTEKKN